MNGALVSLLFAVCALGFCAGAFIVAVVTARPLLRFLIFSLAMALSTMSGLGAFFLWPLL